jgi:hypothetical protein
MHLQLTPKRPTEILLKSTFPATGLRTIDQGAFKNLGLTSVSIPATVETVGIYSFMNNPITTVLLLEQVLVITQPLYWIQHLNVCRICPVTQVSP